MLLSLSFTLILHDASADSSYDNKHPPSTLQQKRHIQIKRKDTEKHARGEEEKKHHFEQSMKYSDGSGFTTAIVQGEVAPVERIVTVMDNFLHQIPKDLKTFQKTKETLSILVEFFDKILRNVGYNPDNPDAPLSWDQAVWRNFVGPLDEKILVILKSVMDDACEVLIAPPQKQSLLSQAKQFFKKDMQRKLSPQTITHLQELIASMSIVIINLKKYITGLPPKAAKTKENRIVFAAYYEKFNNIFNEFMGIYHTETQPPQRRHSASDNMNQFQERSTTKGGGTSSLSSIGQNIKQRM